jgi:hypothetical protein
MACTSFLTLSALAASQKDEKDSTGWKEGFRAIRRAKGVNPITGPGSCPIWPYMASILACLRLSYILA